MKVADKVKSIRGDLPTTIDEYILAQQNCGLMAGDYVTVAFAAPTREFGWDSRWACGMNASVGRRMFIKCILSGARGIRLSNDYAYPFFCILLPSKSRERTNTGGTMNVAVDKCMKTPHKVPHNRREYIELQPSCGIQQGDAVKVLAEAKSYCNGWGAMWYRSMTKTVGNIYTVKRVNAGSSGITLSNGMTYPFFALERISDGV